MKRIRIDLGTKKVPSLVLDKEVKQESADFLIDILKNEYFKFQGDNNDNK